MHSRSKRAETIALLDSGATENFMNLEYAKYLHLPIKTLPQPRKLFNVDGTRNRAGDLKYYVDLNTRTGSRNTNLRYFLTDLGDHKIILGYPWFATAHVTAKTATPTKVDSELTDAQLGSRKRAAKALEGT
jgi:hypothetical protein